MYKFTSFSLFFSFFHSVSAFFHVYFFYINFFLKFSSDYWGGGKKGVLPPHPNYWGGACPGCPQSLRIAWACIHVRTCTNMGNCMYSCRGYTTFEIIVGTVVSLGAFSRD